MKKSLVVVALAGAMAFTAASAETVLYGSIRLGADVAKNHVGQLDTVTNTAKAKRGLAMEDYGSRIGLRGSEDLGNGTKVLFQVEFGFDGMSNASATDTSNGLGGSNRLAWLGLQGDWGTIALGRQNNPFTESLNADTEADMFNGNGVTSALRYATGAVMFSAVNNGTAFSNFQNVSLRAMPTRVGNSIAYVSPSFSGFNFVVAGIAQAPASAGLNYDSAYNSSKGFDMYTVGLNYEHESGFYAKAAYLGANLTKDHKTANVYGLNVGFNNEQFGVNADFGAGSRGNKNTIVNGVESSTGKVTSTAWDLGGHFSFGPDYFSTVRATVGQAEVKFKNGETDKAKLTTWAVGFEQKLSTRTRVWVEYTKTNNKWNPADRADSRKNNVDTFGVGIRHDF